MAVLDQTATSAELRSAGISMAVIGIGAIEQHGRHLPVGTDFIAVAELSRGVAFELRAWLLPALPISLSECHGPLEGTVWLKPSTLAAVLREIARSLQAQEVRVLVVLNGHGGNFILGPTIERLNRELHSLRVIMPPEWLAGPPGEKPVFGTPEVHAGEGETSTMLYYAPHLVRAERVDGPIAVGREFLDYTTLDRLNPEGTWGYPTRADAAKGERSVHARVRALTAFVRDAMAVLEGTTHP